MTKKEEKKPMKDSYPKPGVDVDMEKGLVISSPDGCTSFEASVRGNIKLQENNIFVNGEAVPSPPATFRSSKVEKFVANKVLFMEAQQKVIQNCKLQRVPEAAIAPIEYNQIATYNLIFELCQEFGITMPHVAGVTPGN